MSNDELRELDLQIAERVMGFDRLSARVDPMNRDGEPQYHMGYPHGHDFAPFYSTDIIAAFAVIKRMHERGVWTQIQTFIHTTQVRVEMGIPSSECQEWGTTAAEAICKCALKANKKFQLVMTETMKGNPL